MSKSIPDDVLVAIAGGEPVVLDAALASGVDVNGFGERVRRTPLMAAAFAGRSDLIHELVHRGAALDVGDAFTGTPLHEAAAMGHLDAVRTLLDLGAGIEAETEMGITALMLAAAWGYGDVVDLLIARGANVHHRDHLGFTARMSAEEKEEDQIAAVLAAVEAATLGHSERSP